MREAFIGAVSPRAATQEPLHCGVVAFNPVISPLSFDVPYVVKERIIPVVDRHRQLAGRDLKSYRPT